MVSSEPIRFHGSLQLHWVLLDVIPWMAVILLFLSVGKWSFDHFSNVDVHKSDLSFSVVVMFTISSVIFIRHGILDDGFFRNPNSLDLVMQASLPIESVDVPTALGLIRQGSLLVDARYAAQFKSGHIINAINIPFYLNRFELKEAMSQFRKDQKIVVYCAGPKCPFAIVVARMLKANGQSDVFVFEGDDLKLHSAVLQAVQTDGVLP